MRPYFAGKLLIKKICGVRPYVPWKAIFDIAMEPSVPADRCVPPKILAHTEDGMVLLRFEDIEVYYPSDASLRFIGSEYWQLNTPNHPAYYEKNGTVVEAGDVVFDCGACEGFFTLNAVNRSSQVHLFEPVEEVARCLRRTFSEHIDKKKVFVWNLALGNTSGSCMIAPDRGDYQGSHVIDDLISASRGYRQVAISTIDLFVEKEGISRVDFIKIDAEGADLSILEGAKGVLRRFLPKVAVATYHSATDALEISAFMKEVSREYKVIFAGTANAWRQCRPLMAHFHVAPTVRAAFIESGKCDRE